MLPWALAGVDLGDHVLEIGPGPGLCTEWLRRRAGRVSAVEIDPLLAASLSRRYANTRVRVVEADAARMPFDDQVFPSAVCLTMLHHVPSAALQDRLLSEAYRVLEPGGVLAGCDSTDSLAFSLAHIFDTKVMVDPSTFERRLRRVGFDEVSVSRARGVFRFRAFRPPCTKPVV